MITSRDSGNCSEATLKYSGKDEMYADRNQKTLRHLLFGRPATRYSYMSGKGNQESEIARDPVFTLESFDEACADSTLDMGESP